MKRVIGAITIVGLLCLYVPSWAQEQAQPPENKQGFDVGYLDGQAAGSRESQTMWCVGGTAGALLLGCIGGGVVTILGYSTASTPSFLPSGNAEYKTGYLEGFKKSTKSKKGTQALIGALIGTGINIAVIALILSSEE